MWCDLGKSVGSRTCDIFSFLFGWSAHLVGSSAQLERYLLLKTPPQLDQWCQSYEQLKGSQNNRKQKKYLFFFMAISHNQCSRLPTDPARSQHKSKFTEATWAVGPKTRVFYLFEVLNRQKACHLNPSFSTYAYTNLLLAKWILIPYFKAPFWQFRLNVYPHFNFKVDWHSWITLKYNRHWSKTTKQSTSCNTYFYNKHFKTHHVPTSQPANVIVTTHVTNRWEELFSLFQTSRCLWQQSNIIKTRVWSLLRHTSQLIFPLVFVSCIYLWAPNISECNLNT